MEPSITLKHTTAMTIEHRLVLWVEHKGKKVEFVIMANQQPEEDAEVNNITVEGSVIGDKYMFWGEALEYAIVDEFVGASTEEIAQIENLILAEMKKIGIDVSQVSGSR